MTNFEKISLGVSIFAIFLSIVTIVITVIIAKKNKLLVDESNTKAEEANSISNEANTKAEEANSISMGALENAVSDRISNSKLNAINSSIQLAKHISDFPEKLTLAQQRLRKAYELHFHSCVEDSWNAYENACAKYLDNKIDRERFRKSYKDEIKQLIEDSEKPTYTNPLTSKYKAIIKVYTEWEHLE